MMRDRGDRAADSTSATGEPATRVGPRDFALPKSAAIAHLLSLLPRARLTLKHNFVLAFHAGNLALATVANGILGFVYWWVTARAFTPTNVGLASADISLMVLLGTAADLGLGMMLQGEIPRHKRLSPHITSAALLGALASGSALGLAYLALAAVFGPNFGTSAGIPSTRVLVVVGIGLQTFSLVLDAALIGMLSAPLRLFRNLLFAAGKLLLVTIAGALVIPEDWQLDAIIASWVIGQAAAALGLASVVWLRGARIWYRPRFDTLGQFVGVAFWHYLVNVVAMAPSLVLPIIIAALLSPEQNAPFYAAWMLLSLAGVVPAALANVLFTLGSGASSRALSGLRFSLSVSLGVRRRRRSRLLAIVKCGAQHVEPGLFRPRRIGSSLSRPQRSADGGQSSLHDCAAHRASAAPGGSRPWRVRRSGNSICGPRRRIPRTAWGYGRLAHCDGTRSRMPVADAPAAASPRRGGRRAPFEPRTEVHVVWLRLS